MRRITMMAAMMLGGCAMPGAGDAAGAAAVGETITYRTGPCFGQCPVYTLTVTPTGGTFEGRQHTAVTGTQAFAVTAEQYRAFADALAPARPSGERLIKEGTPDCPGAATDMASADVRWGNGDHLYIYYGCFGTALKPIRDAVRAAPKLLPVAELIGGR